METLSCPGCDLLQTLPPLPPGAKARCPRCGEIIASQPIDPLERPLALAIAATIVFIVANTAPLMTLSNIGRDASTTILGGVHQMWLHGEEVTAVVVAFCAVIAPAGYIAFVLVVLLAIRQPPAPALTGDLLHAADFMGAWAMDDVMLLGILVSLVKIAQLATINPGIGMYAVAVLVVLLCEIIGTFNPREVWNRIQWADDTLSPRISGVASGSGTAG
ncbi:MAG: paraquat-inducible protein A [Burkholderiales bacterium]